MADDDDTHEKLGVATWPMSRSCWRTFFVTPGQSISVYDDEEFEAITGVDQPFDPDVLERAVQPQEPEVSTIQSVELALEKALLTFVRWSVWGHTTTMYRLCEKGFGSILARTTELTQNELNEIAVHFDSIESEKPLPIPESLFRLLHARYETGEIRDAYGECSICEGLGSIHQNDFPMNYRRCPDCRGMGIDPKWVPEKP